MINESIVKKFSEKSAKESVYMKIKESYYDSWQSSKSADSLTYDDQSKQSPRNAFGPMFTGRDHFNSLHCA